MSAVCRRRILRGHAYSFLSPQTSVKPVYEDRCGKIGIVHSYCGVPSYDALGAFVDESLSQLSVTLHSIAAHKNDGRIRQATLHFRSHKARSDRKIGSSCAEFTFDELV